MSASTVEYDDALVDLLFKIDQLRKLIESTDIDKFAYFYVNGPRGPNCLFARVAYQRTVNSGVTDDILKLIKAIVDEYADQEK